MNLGCFGSGLLTVFVKGILTTRLWTLSSSERPKSFASSFASYLLMHSSTVGQSRDIFLNFRLTSNRMTNWNFSPVLLDR